MGLFSAQISAKEMVPVCRQLATTYEAGIPIMRALELVSKNTRDTNARKVLVTINARLQQGSTLGEAAREQEKYLPQFFVELLASGEHGGKLDVVLKDVAQYYEDRVEMNRTITGALTYPCFLLTVAWFLGTFALKLIGQLNFRATTPFNFAKFLGEYGRFQLSALIVFAVGFTIMVILSRWNIPQWGWGWFSTHMWPIKNVARKFALARFFRSMSLLIGSGLNIKRCISSSAEVTANPYIRKDLMQALPFVSEGATLTQAFTASHTLTPVARDMLYIGEQSGNLEECLRKVSEYHFTEARHAVKIAVTVLNSVVMLAVGGIVGYIVISFYTKLLTGYDPFLN